MKQDDRMAQNDAFWDIDDMLPPPRASRPFSRDVGTVELTVEAASSAPAGEEAIPRDEARIARAREALQSVERRQQLRAAAALGDRVADRKAEAAPASDQPLLTYETSGNPLLEQVTVYPWPTRYSFYERFRRDAKRYFDRTEPETPRVSFFSYTPQYVQLSPVQLRFYFYWRDRFRHGEAIAADYPYLLLYLYEIINLPDLLPPSEGAALMARLWLTYRDTYPALDRTVPEWLCDHCLLHRISPPTLTGAMSAQLARLASLKEFYVGSDPQSPSPFASALFAYGSNYDFRKSKFITEENRSLFETHIRGAFLYAFAKVEAEKQTVFVPIGQRAMTRVTLHRDAYAGALCAYDIKRRLTVVYLSCARSVELRYTVTDTVKFAENQVRALLGIRARFHTPNLPQPLRRAVEEYFAPFKKAQKKETVAPPPAYEALYEPLHREFSPALARDLEARAWATTELLTETEDGIFAEAPPSAPLPPPNEPPSMAPLAPVPSEAESEAPSWLRAAVRACLDGNRAAFAEVAAATNRLPDALAEAVNEALFPLLGDVALEEDGRGYRIVPDYLEEITVWMKQ